MGCLRILLERRILNHILFKRVLYLFQMKFLRFFMGERLMVENLGLLHYCHYSGDFTSLEAIRESYSVVSFQTSNEKSSDCRKNIILRPELNIMNRSTAGNGQSLTPIRILVTFSMILIFQCMTLHSTTIAALMS